MGTEELAAVLDALRAAVLAVYRADGTAYMSPVWYRVANGSVEIVVAEGDLKLERLRSDPRCIFMAFEIEPPFRGVRIEAQAQLSWGDVDERRHVIASRYLGQADARRYVEQRTKPGTLVRLSLDSARTWDLGAILPS